jgi:hypothetical protein
MCCKMIILLVLISFVKNILAYNPGTSWRNAYAFSAVKDDGSVVAWGSSRDGGNAPSGLTNCQTIFSANEAFACLKADGSVVAWGLLVMEVLL